ncbi:MAG: hypothetical protein IVW53_08415 [Chloroflexi bacterium]|nr:hypothetical protein [Chloroflexota bacterium]
MRARTGRASAILATSALLAVFVFAPATRAQVDPGSRAVSYLAAHQAADGSLDGSIGETEDLVLGAAASGYDPATLTSTAGKTPFDYLATRLPAATADAGGTAKLILALIAGGRDPRTFGGLDLVARLGAAYDATSGHFGDGSTFTQALAILALAGAAAPDVPLPTRALDALVAAQDGDGSWNYTGFRDAPLGGDSNSTAVAIMALVAGGRVATSAPLTAATGYLHSVQQPDGGFPYQGGAGAVSDPDSDALVLEALAALGADAAGPAWTVGTATPYGDLLRFQDAASGGFHYPGKTAPDTFTTSEVPQGLAQAPLPVVGHFAAGAGLTTYSSRATAALRYLEGALKSDGSLDGSTGATEDLLLGAAAAGYDPSTVRTCGGRSSYSYLASAVDHVTADAGSTAKLILAVVAGRWNPGTFGGRDLFGRLDGFYDPATGRYGDGSTFGQSLAILTLTGTGRPVPAAAVAHLNGLQGTDGSWNYQAVANGTAGDTNSTAIALMALAAVGDRSRVAAGLAWLHRQQGADGGFPYRAGPGATSDPDSDALVLEALTALRESPTAPSWTIGGHTLLDDIVRHQATNGGFVFPGNTAPDAFTTSQVPMALERVPFPGTDRWTSGLAVPGRACPGAVTPPGGSTPPPTSTVAPPATSTTGPGWIVAILAAILGSILALRRPRRA